jgi:hypothetical protein
MAPSTALPIQVFIASGAMRPNSLTAHMPLDYERERWRELRYQVQTLARGMPLATLTISTDPKATRLR